MMAKKAKQTEKPPVEDGQLVENAPNGTVQEQTQGTEEVQDGNVEVPGPGAEENKDEPQGEMNGGDLPPTQEEIQKLIDEKYEAGTLWESELDEYFTIPQIYDYAEKHNYKYSAADNKPELIVQVAKCELNEPEEKIEELDQIQVVKDIRKEIDGTMIFVDNQQVEDKEAKKHLFYSKSWLGKLLEFLGAENPYHTKEKIQNASQIPPTAEKVLQEDIQKELHQFRLLSHLEGTLALRAGIQDIIEKIDTIDLSGVSSENGRHAAICKTQAWICACNAKFELGDTLAKIREQ